tara:strand:+ start:1925 stop:2281 length:357 start_codon:yes stop_codon:yes gene_type:complete
MAQLHFANLAPSSKKTTLLSVLGDDHTFTRNETMQSHIDNGGTVSTWNYAFSLVIVTGKTPEELVYLQDEIYLSPIDDYKSKYKFIEPVVGTEHYNTLRDTGQLTVTFAEFQLYIELT